MVAGKVKAAIGLTKSQPNPPPSPTPSPSSGKVQKGASFSRSFGGYFPRSSAQVQPRPPDVNELIRLVEDLRERESRLKTELLENKLLKESVAILPVLEGEITKKDFEIEVKNKTINLLESENEKLRREVENLRCKLLQQTEENEENIKNLEDQVTVLKKTAQFSEEMTISQRFQSSAGKNLKKSVSLLENYNFNKNEIEMQKSKNKVAQFSEEMNEVTEIVSVTARSRVPRVPKPPPKPTLIIPQSTCVSATLLSPSSSNSSSSTSLSGSADSALSEMSVVKPPAPPPPPPPPIRPVFKVPTKSAPPPPPPPPMKGAKNGAQKVRRVPEVVEFYHSLMRRDTRRDSGNGAAAEVAVTANARDMIGEIENRSTHLLAVSFFFYCSMVCEMD